MINRPRSCYNCFFLQSHSHDSFAHFHVIHLVSENPSALLSVDEKKTFTFIMTRVCVLFCMMRKTSYVGG